MKVIVLQAIEVRIVHPYDHLPLLQPEVMLQEAVACGLPEVHLQAGYNLMQLYVRVQVQQPVVVDTMVPAHDLHLEHIQLLQEAVVVQAVHVQAITLLLPEVRVHIQHRQEVAVAAVPVSVAEVAAVAAVVQAAAVVAVVQVDADKC